MNPDIQFDGPLPDAVGMLFDGIGGATESRDLAVVEGQSSLVEGDMDLFDDRLDRVVIVVPDVHPKDDFFHRVAKIGGQSRSALGPLNDGIRFVAAKRTAGRHPFGRQQGLQSRGVRPTLMDCLFEVHGRHFILSGIGYLGNEAS